MKKNMSKQEQQIAYMASMLNEAMDDKAVSVDAQEFPADFFEIQRKFGLDAEGNNKFSDAICDNIKKLGKAKEVYFDDLNIICVKCAVHGHIENDGIGPYEYWGHEEYDRGTDRQVMDDYDFDIKAVNQWLDSVGLSVNWPDEIGDNDISWDSDWEDDDGKMHGGTTGSMACRGEITVIDAKKCAEFIKQTLNTVSECDGGGTVGGGDAGGGAPASVAGPGIQYGDVLGHCDHGKDGYLGQGCFHVPSKTLPLQRRYELPSKKKKGHKNPYVKGATVIGKLTEEHEKLLKEVETSAPQNAVKMLTRAIYQHSEMLADQVDLIYRKCEELGKSVPSEIRVKLDALKSAGLDYVRLVDTMTSQAQTGRA